MSSYCSIVLLFDCFIVVDLAIEQCNNVAMILRSIRLQNFRSYPKAQFEFDLGTTIIIGPNTAGKTNIVEAVSLLSLGKSFKGATDDQILRFEASHGRVIGTTDENKLEVIIQEKEQGRMKYAVNGVAKRRVDFVGRLPAVFFSPVDLEIISGSPSHRREFLDTLLEQTNASYRRALTEYMKALRQRNALIQLVQETGKRDNERFEYWDGLLIQYGSFIHQQRASLIEFINNAGKNIFNCQLVYDHSIVSEARLNQYRDAEVGSGVTLVGPHRDDVSIIMSVSTKPMRGQESVKIFGSRGQQRLVVLQLKLLQLQYMEEKLSVKPLFVLDDIFSELDAGHIDLVLNQVPKQQTVITTTHEEFVASFRLSDSSVIELRV